MADGESPGQTQAAVAAPEEDHPLAFSPQQSSYSSRSRPWAAWITVENRGKEPAGFQVEKLELISGTTLMELTVDVITTDRVLESNEDMDSPSRFMKWDPGSTIMLDPGDRWWVKVFFDIDPLAPHEQLYTFRVFVLTDEGRRVDVVTKVRKSIKVPLRK
jgi:hypothetical protein